MAPTTRSFVFLLCNVLAVLSLVADAFAPLRSCHVTQRSTFGSKRFLADSPPPSRGDDKSDSGGYQPDEEFNVQDSGSSGGSVDWDAEWKKVVSDQKAGKSIERPGQGYYKSDAEIAAIRAANKATKQIDKAASSMPSMPSFGSLDWKFWVGLLVVISIGTSLLTAQPAMPPPGASEGSYYI